VGLRLSGLVGKGIGLSLVGAAVAVVPTAPVVAKPDPTVVQEMRAAADGDVTVTTSPATGRVSFVGATGDLFPSERSGRTASGATAKANGYVEKYARAFGTTAGQLGQGRATKNPAGYTVDFTQTYQGVPVFASKLRAHVDAQGDLTSVSGYVAPSITLDVTPRLDKDAAVAKAIKLASQAPAGAGEAATDKPRASSLTATKAELVVYRMGAIQGVAGRNLLAWVVEVTDGKLVRETSVLDAKTGKPVNRYSMIAHDLDRELHEESIDTDPVWSEGDAFPSTLDADQASEVQGTGEAYWLFKNTFNRDSYDGAGAKMVTVNNDPTIDCPNANWNGKSTNYCSGVSSDDTVAHEWGHAYTEYTSGLLYQWQPGAMNEAYSDIWGETVDMLNDRFNTPDEETKRTDGKCSEGTRGDISVVVSPDEQVGTCTAAAAAFGPIIDDVTDDLVVGTDAIEEDEGEVVGTDTDGCSPFGNPGEIAGKFVYVDRGLCAFADKIANAEDAGATGIVFGNNRAGVSSVAGFSELYGAMVSQEDGTKIKAAAGPLSINLKDAEAPGSRDASYRWLSGEDDPAFGGAIRDMWNPNCYGDPAKVSDEEYFCDTDDSGGVHTNSGVVNHGYALLVDGGTFNGITVPGIGLDKAANIYWHTQTSYLTSTSGFGELADGLEASCAALTGNTGLKKLALGSSPTGGGPADGGALAPISASDCAAVTKMIDATELRVEPTQCNFRLMFRRGTVGCGNGLVTKNLYSQGFESGLPASWTTDVEADNAHFDPTVTTALPLVTEGGVAHKGGSSVLYFNDKGDDGNYGSCNGDAEDYSSRVGVATPQLTVPAGELPRLSFDHYVASEVEFDGGNVKYSVNGGAYEQVPDSAWLYNAPGGHLETAAGGNTNPMAGETAFTGTDGGQPTGSWGNSVIDLLDLAATGDKISFRFDFGMDGCNGIDGWYIDNVTLSICAKPVVPPKPSPATVAKTGTSVKGIVKIRVKVASGATPSGLVLVRIRGRGYTTKLVHGVLTVRAKSQMARLWRNGFRKAPAYVYYGGDKKVARFAGHVTIKLIGRQ
jgi:Zn-dependent metalloprotease